MSRDGAQSKIDYLTNSILGNTNKQSRTALNNAVRYNAMLQLFDDREPAYNVPGSVERSRIRNSLAGLDPRRISDEQLATALDRSVQDLTEEFNSTVNPDDDNTIDTPQTKLTNRAFRTELGSITSNEISFNRGRFFEANSRDNLLQQGGAGYAFKGYMSSFFSGVDDIFGSRVLYDNVFGAFETGEVSLSQRRRQIDPEDYAATATQKVLQTLVNKNIADSKASLNKIEREFQSFFGESAVSRASESGLGLTIARDLLDTSSNAINRINNELRSLNTEVDQINFRLNSNYVLYSEQDFDEKVQDLQQRSDHLSRIKLITSQLVDFELDRKIALDSIKQGYNSVSKTNSSSTIVNKAGVRTFIDLFNSAKSNITIQTYQFQNETLSASLRDVVKRRALENIQNKSGDPFELNFVLAYPKNRFGNGTVSTTEDRYNLGGVGYSINGPNLIEVLTMKQFEEDLKEELFLQGYSREDINKSFKINIELRDRKFHPKLYMTDTMAAVGTQNLTAPVGNSLNQAGSNFEQMYIVHNHFDTDADLAAYREGRKQGAIQSENSLKNSELRSSLLYRQIKQASQYEREFIRAQKGGTVPALGMGRKDNNSRGYNVGFAGDIYSHLTNTLDYAYEQSGLVHASSGATGFKKLKAKSDVSMFMILDGAFMLQLGDIAFNEKALLGEMGDEVTKTFREKDPRVAKYKSYQNKLFDLLITNNANVVVDKKNYKEAVYNPIADKIEKQGSAELKKNFAKFGKNLGLMAGNNIFGSDIEAMDAYLRAQGFTKEAGFSASDRKQIMGMGSGNIRMARSPRQHAKSFGLVDYSQNKPELVSYYQGSSNMGFYSLDAGDKTNTEIGVMFGKDKLSRVRDQAVVFGYENELDLEMAKQAAQQAVFSSNQMKDFSLSEEQEIDELRNIQDRFYQTYNQLSTNTIENRYIDNIKNAPMWQSNVNSGALQIQKARLEDLKQNLGLSDTAFNIVERLGEDGGVKSLNITINTASILGDSEFTNSETANKKLTFEISVLNSPNDRRIINRNSPTDPRNGEMDNPGMVYFVDKNKLIGNGIFVNDSGESVEVMGRHNYNDKFQYGTEAGTVTVASGSSAYMSSIDITTQAFGQIIGEITMQRHVTDPLTRYNKIRKQGGEDRLLTDYLSVMLTGKKAHLKSNGESLDSLDLISKSLRMIEFDSLGGDIISKVLSKEVSAEQIRSLIPTSSVERGSESKIEALKTFINTFRIALADEEVNLFGNHASNSDVRNITLDSTKHLLQDKDVAKKFLDTYLIPNFKQLVKQSPELLGEIMKYADTNNYESIEQANLSAKLSMVFEPFLQSAEDTTYGGQQGYYRTLMYGLSSHRDAPSADLMNDYDDGKNIGQARRYARLNALGYTPTTDIHKFLYRSIASGASSTGKTDASLNSELLQQGARQVGSAQNFDVLQSVGIGTKIDRSTYVSGFKDELTIDGEFRQTLKDQGLSDAAIENVEREMKLQYADQNREFMSITTMDSKGQSHTKGTDNMIFFTGSAKKISQLPQRIKNALGARPLYQYGVEAQKALQSMTDPSGGKSTTLSNVTSSYVTNYGKKTLDVLDSQIEYFTEQLKNTAEGTDANKEAVEKIQMYSMFKQDLSLKAVRKSTGQVDYQAGHLFKLGAIYTGKIKSVLSADQAAYVSRIKEDIDALFSGELMKDETPQEREELKQEMIRSYVLRASLDNSGLGKMIAGNDRTKYNIALLQLSGTYTDTFLANPLQGTVYRNEGAYNNLKFNKNINMSETPDLINHKDVVVAGQREGYMVAQQLSTKSSMMAEEADLKATANTRQGERTLLREDDFIQEDSEGRYVQMREGKVIRSASEKRTVSTLRGEVDNTNFGPTSSTATKSTAAYGRKGEFSIDYIFASLERDGNFANNEYLNELIRLRSILPGGARRVEGTDSSALVKGVANFAGQAQTYYIDPQTGERVVMNTFQFLESQILDKFEDGQVGGSLAAMLKAENRSYAFTQRDRDGNIKGYTPLSSMVSGLYNANNFKSFVWSHGATILQETRGTGMVENNFMLNELLGIGSDGTKRNQVEMARKAASGLLISFGSSYLKGGQDAEFKKAIIQGLRTGSAGKNYQKLAGVLQLTKGVGGDDAVEYLFDEIIQKEDKKKGLFFSDANLAGLRGLNANDIKAVMSGDPNSEATIKASERFMAQIGGMLTSQASIIGKQGYMEMSSFSQRQAALITTAIDLMHQISANESSYSLPSDIDKSSERMKQVLTSILGGEQFTKPSDQDGLMDEAFQMIQGINENVNMVALYADITYSQSKDGVGTETVGRHEAQHLMMPFLGDIKNFRKNGQLSNMQHTFASLMSLSTGANTLMGNSILQQKGFSKAKAWDMTTPGSVDQMVLTSSFTQEKFLGFYRANAQDAFKQVELTRQFKKINKLMSDGTYYDLDLMRQPPVNNKDGKKPRAIDNLNNDIVQYVEKLYSVGGPTIDSRFKERKVKEIQHKIFGADGNSLNTEEVTRFLMQRQDLVVMELQKLNDTYNANTDKALGSDATSSFIESMSNKDMFFSLPDLEFQAQDGMAVVRSKGSISTFLPAAEMMKKLGVQHADFIDPLISVYKDLTEVFAPGTIAYNAMQKVLASQNEGKAAVLTSTESTALQRVMQAANRMIPEAQKATIGARAQEAFGGKTKYKGFTSTGIGSFLVPFDSVALSTTKLAEAGYSNNERKTKALQATLQNRFASKRRVETDEEYYYRISQTKTVVPTIEVLDKQTLKKKEYITNLIPGKSLELTTVTQELQNRVKNYYDLQIQALVQGISSKLESSFAEMVATSQMTKLKVDSILTLVNNGTPFQHNEVANKNVIQIYELRDELRTNLSKNKSLSAGDRYLYETNLLNIEGEVTRLELGLGAQLGLSEDGKKVYRALTAEDKKNREITQEVFKNVTSVLNENSADGKGLAFSNLGASSFDIQGYELFDSKFSTSAKVSMGDLGTTTNIVQQLNDLGSNFNDKDIKRKAQVEMANQYLDDLKSQYTGLLNDLRTHSLERDESTVKDKAKEEAAYSEALKAHENILNSIETARQEITLGVYKEKEGFDRIFTSLNASLLINDQVNVQSAEVFRSPPPGSTDPRLHSYRIMNGVTALNRIASLTGAGGMSESRSSTSSYITAVGVVTYGGGDFDGDPYTAILHQSADTTSKIIENRMIINKNEVLARNLRAEIKSSTNQEDIQAKTIKLQEAEAKIISEKEKLESNQSLVENQIKQGHENFNARARRQAAEYFGVDERILVKGKDLLGEVDYYKDPDTGVLTRGYGSKTYNADDVFSLMNTGHGLVEGLDQKGSTLFALYDTLDHLTGFRRNAGAAMQNIKKAAASYKNFKTANAEAGTSQDNILSIYRELLATNNTLTDPQNVGNKYLADILVNNDSATAESLLQMFSSIEEEEAKYKAERALSKDLDLSLEQNSEYAKEFMHRFIGADLMAQMQAHETYSGFMTKGAGMQVSEGGMDVLLKTLGSAGGEVLGKTYNTIIGTTFKDSSLISFAQAVLKKDEDGNNSELRTLLEQEINTKSTVEDPNAASYFEGLESALGKSRGVQGFMKNIHQLLRDSIKLKSDQDMVGKLQEASMTYQEVTEKIRIHDRDSSGTAEEQKIRESLLLERDQSINTLSSSLGDGPGLKALINLDYLIKSSKKTKGNQQPGLTNTQFSFMFLDSGTTKSPEFTSLLDRYNAEIEQQYNQLTGNPEVDAAKRSRLNRARIDEAGSTENYDKLINQDGTKEAFLKLAQYKVSNQMVNLVAGYRMSESLKLSADKNVSLNNSYIELLADTANSKNSQSSTISSTEIRKNIVDSYVVPDNPLEITDGNKAVQLRKVEAMGEYLGVDSSSLYKEQGLSSYKTEYNAALAKAADKAGLSVQDYIITYEQRYQKSREQASSLFGYSGEGLNTFTNLEGLRTDMSAMFKNGVEGANDSRIEKLMKVMDAESMQMMAQLVGSDKLTTSGFEVFNALFEGVLSNVMVDELDKVESELFEATKKEAKASNKYLTDEDIRNNPEFQQKLNQTKKRTIKRKSIQLMIGGGEGDRSTSVEGSVVRGITAAAMENDAVLDEYIKSQEGSLSSQQSEAMSQMAEHLLLKSSASQDQFNNLLDAVGGPVGLTEDEKAGMSEEQQRQELFNRRKQKRLQTEQRLKEQQNIRFANAVRQQENDRKAFIDDNPYLRRGSMLSKVGKGLIGSLASNKGSSTLDILAPIALTAIGSAISEGDVDATTMQDLGGATFTAAMYARTGFVDSASRKVYANRMGMAQMTGAVFKFKSGLQRYEGQGYEEGEKVLLAARDTLVRETISMAVNKAVAPALSQSIASRLGNNQAIAMDILGGKQHQAVQQISGNIGASLISAATSTLISGMFLKTVVPSPEKQMHADLQQFDVNVATVNSVNQQIAYARAQQAAAEDVEVSESNGEPELSSYNVVTSSTYNADSSYDTMALYDEQELDIATDGSLSFDFS